MPNAVYELSVDWDKNGNFTGTHDDITAYALAGENFPVTWSRGRDKRLNPGQSGTMEFSLQLSGNEALFSPENVGGDLYGLIIPGRPVRLRATYNAVTYELFHGFISRITPRLANDKNYIYFYCVDGTDWLSRARVPINLNKRYEYYRGGASRFYKAYGNNWLAQIFTPQEDHTITDIKLPIERDDNPGDLTVGLRATAAGEPTGSDLASATMDDAEVTEDDFGAWYNFHLNTEVDLIAGTRYAIVLRTAAGGASDYIRWMSGSGGG